MAGEEGSNGSLNDVHLFIDVQKVVGRGGAGRQTPGRGSISDFGRRS